MVQLDEKGTAKKKKKRSCTGEIGLWVRQLNVEWMMNKLLKNPSYNFDLKKEQNQNLSHMNIVWEYEMQGEFFKNLIFFRLMICWGTDPRFVQVCTKENSSTKLETDWKNRQGTNCKKCLIFSWSEK